MSKPGLWLLKCTGPTLLGCKGAVLQRPRTQSNVHAQAGQGVCYWVNRWVGNVQALESRCCTSWLNA